PGMGIGPGAPREPVRLVGDPHAPRMLSISGAREFTREMADYARRRVQELAALDLAGYVLKGAAPSCGLRDVPVWEDAGHASRPGQGLVAAGLACALPPPAAADKRAPGPPRDLARWLYPLAFLVGAALVVVFMWYHIARERSLVMDHWRARPTTFAGDRGGAGRTPSRGVGPARGAAWSPRGSIASPPPMAIWASRWSTRRAAWSRRRAARAPSTRSRRRQRPRCPQRRFAPT